MIRRFSTLALVIGMLALAAPLVAQDAAAAAAAPAADPVDVASVDAILAAVYDAISGAAGEARNWDRFRSLFVPDARLIPTRALQAGGFNHSAVTPDGYVQQFGSALERNGFFEREIHRVEERYGPVVHAFSTYESRRTAADPQPFTRGINSFQLFWDGTRWWVVSIYWFGESPGHPIPAKYLPGSG